MLNLLQWTYGIVIITGKRNMINIKKIIINPVTISLIIGLIMFFTGVKLPEIINSTLSFLASMNTPVAMIVLGYYLSCVKIKDLFFNAELYIPTIIRLTLIPVLTLAVLYLLPFGHGQTGMITLISASTPIGTSTAIFAQKFGQDYQKAVCMVCLSTILSIITIPLVMHFAQMILM